MTINYQLTTINYPPAPPGPASNPSRASSPCRASGVRAWGKCSSGCRRSSCRLTPPPAQLLPCPRGCDLAHDIVGRPDGSLAATCRGDPERPFEIPLTPADITPLEVSWSKLARALSQALGLHSKLAILPPPNTVQFGAWSADAVPAILTIQACPSAFFRVVPELVARLQRPFMLFAPTSNHFDAHCLELLSRVGAAFFPLDSTVMLADDGRLRPAKSPGELFAEFTPQPKEVDEDVAHRAFALVMTLDSERPMKPPALLTVFRLYCIAEMSAAQIAQKCHSSKTVVISRLKLIQAKTGVSPKDFRRISSHLAKIDESTADSRAARIHRPRLISDDQSEGSGE